MPEMLRLEQTDLDRSNVDSAGRVLAFRLSPQVPEAFPSAPARPYFGSRHNGRTPTLEPHFGPAVGRGRAFNQVLTGRGTEAWGASRTLCSRRPQPAVGNGKDRNEAHDHQQAAVRPGNRVGRGNCGARRPDSTGERGGDCEI